MDCKKIGETIRSLRLQHGLTQKELAERLNVSDKAISKWECGLGCPDLSIWVDLGDVLKVNIEEMLQGGLKMNEMVKGNIEKMRFYVCPQCGNIITSTGEMTLSCCGRKLEPLKACKDETHQLQVELIEDEWYITSEHEMTKLHYISFIAFVTGDKVFMIKQYPEWGIQCRMPRYGHGKLYSYCIQHGLKYQII